MQSLFGFDLPTAQKWVIAFGVILVLLVLLGLFARQIKDGRLRIKGQGGGRARQPRLGVVDIHDLDRQRQLVLIRRDNVEHLVMIGGASDVVVETNIVRSGGRAAMPVQPDLGLPDRPLPFDTLIPPEPREPAEDPRRAAPPAPVAQAPAFPDPPPRVPSRLSPTAAEAAVAAAAGGAAVLGAAALAQAATSSAPSSEPRASEPPAPAPMAAAPSVQPPNFARDHAPAPVASAVELDDMARQLDEALKRPFSAVRPGPSPSMAAPPISPPAPEPVVKPAEPAPAPVRSEAPPVVVPAPEPVSAPASTRIVPLDVEAELEMALGLKPERLVPKPAAAVAPPEPPKAAEPQKPVEAQKPAEPPKPVEPPKAAEPAKPPQAPPAASPLPPAPEPASAAAPEIDLHEPETPEERAEANPSVAPPARSEPAAEAEPKPQPESQPAPEAEPKTIDPFSVDAIEAEFARLLGRDPKAKS